MQPVPKYSEHYSGLCYITIASGGNCLAECLAHERTSRKELVRGLPKIVPACVYRCMFWEPIIPHILLRDSINPLSVLSRPIRTNELNIMSIGLFLVHPAGNPKTTENPYNVTEIFRYTN